jgi:hypothetical protein
MQFFSQRPEHRPRVDSDERTTVDEAAMLLRDRPNRNNETNILNFIKTIYISGFLLCVSLKIYCEWEAYNYNAMPLYFILQNCNVNVPKTKTQRVIVWQNNKLCECPYEYILKVLKTLSLDIYYINFNIIS